VAVEVGKVGLITTDGVAVAGIAAVESAFVAFVTGSVARAGNASVVMGDAKAGVADGDAVGQVVTTCDADGATAINAADDGTVGWVTSRKAITKITTPATSGVASARPIPSHSAAEDRRRGADGEPLDPEYI
jgi:hypothetical protein